MTQNKVSYQGYTYLKLIIDTLRMVRTTLLQEIAIRPFAKYIKWNSYIFELFAISKLYQKFWQLGL